MSLTTVTVSITANLFLGGPLPRGTVKFELTGADRDGSIVVPQPTTVTLDENGQGSVALWPNARGTQGTQYRVIVRNAAGELQQSALATVPASNCNLHEILQLAAPPVVDDAQAAALDAQEHAAEAATSAGAAQASRQAADADAAATAADRGQTGLDRVATGADRTQTGLDRVQTGQDKVATAADRVQTGQDRVATAADRVQTGQDKAATAADRVQTGQDRTAASTSATLAQDWAAKTAGGQVAATDYSAKEFAQGTQASTGGSAKNWAQQTGADVTGAAAGSRSAKSWAQDSLAGATYGGSAKDWAQSATAPDGGTAKSAKSYASDAATSATAAAVANALGQAVDKTGAAETSTSTGAGDLTLAGALTGFQAFSALCVDYEWVEYRIRALDGAGLLTSTQEHGWGLYRTGGTLVRVLVLDSSASGSGRVSFAAGTKVVSLVRRMRDMPTVHEVLRAGLDSTAVTATTLITWRPRRPVTLSDLQASLATASSSGPVTLDIRVNGVSLLTTLLSIAQGSKTSVGGTAAVFADPDLAPDDEVTIVCTAAGTGAAGLCITLVGNETPVSFMDGLSLRLTPEDMRPFHTRASSAWAFNAAGVLTQYAANVLRVVPSPNGVMAALREPASTNGCINNSMVGAVLGNIGTSGTLPSGWAKGNGTGAAMDLVGTGTENGIPYLDIRVYGNTGTGGNVYVYMAPTNGVAAFAAVQGDVLTASAFMRLVAGSWSGSPTRQFQVEERNSSGTYQGNGSLAITPSNADLVTQRFALTRTLLSASAAISNPALVLTLASAIDVDMTFRIGAPQIEKQPFATSPILTTGSAATRAVDDISGALGGWFAQASGGVEVEFQHAGLPPSTGNQIIVSIDDNSITNRHAIYTSGGAGRQSIFRNVGNVEVTPRLVLKLNDLAAHKLAYRYRDGDSAAYMDGGGSEALPTSNATPMPSGQTNWRIGKRSDGNESACLYVSALRFRRSAPNDNKLKRMTR